MSDLSPVGYRKLNELQQVMALWDRIHPYNVAQVVRLRGRLETDRLQSAIQTACRHAGVGLLSLNRDGTAYRYDPVESVALHDLGLTVFPANNVWEGVTPLLNAPFPAEAHHPIRWAACDDGQTDSQFLVMVAQHLAADAISMQLLLRLVLTYYVQGNVSQENLPFQVAPPDEDGLMQHHRRCSRSLRGLAHAVRMRFQLREVHLMPFPRQGSERATIHVRTASTGFLPRLVRSCRFRKVTVNDACLTALGSALADMTADHRRGARRRKLALATAVDLRRYAREDVSHCFGLFVSHWITVLERPDAEISQLLTAISHQTRKHKADKLFIGPHWDFRTLIWLTRWCSLRHTADWYRKMYTLSAAVSTVKLNRAWFGLPGKQILDYFLVPPTGPAVPLILAAATLDDDLRLTLVSKEAGLSDVTADSLLSLVLSKLEQIAANP